MDEMDATLEFTSYPLDGEASALRSVMFGPVSDEFALLIELNPETGLLTVTVGNGPRNADIPSAIPQVLREVADLVEDLQNSEEFWAGVAASEIAPPEDYRDTL